MILKTIMIIDQINKIDQLKTKIANLKEYVNEHHHQLILEVVVMGSAVSHFDTIDENDELVNSDMQIALCNNSLKGNGIEPISKFNIHTVTAGIGEILTKKAEGWQDFLII